MLAVELVEDNPWWADPDMINFDPQIELWRNSVIRWAPQIRRAFDLGEDLVYSLRGPRRTGKTTTLKIMIKELLEDGVLPWCIMYYAFDVESNPKELVALIKNYLDNTKTKRGKKRCFLFLDEISSIKDWQKGVKKLWDQRRLENCTVLATGSNAADLKISTERLPGRRGHTSDALDRVMHSMSFSEFVSVMDADLKKATSEAFLNQSNRAMVFDELMNRRIHPSLEKMQICVSGLNRCLFDYMLTGGIPEAVEQYARSNRVDEITYTDHLNAILGDLGALNKSTSMFEQLARCIVRASGWTSSWRSLRKDTDIGADSTVSSYVNTLEDMFIVSVMYRYDSERKRALYQKEKKIHFWDPFYFHVLNGWISNKDSFETSHRFVECSQNQGILVEGIAANHLAQLAFLRSQKKQTFLPSTHVYYWRYHTDREVDLVYNDSDNVEIPIEVKFQKKITNRDLDGLISFKKQTGTDRALMITKDVLSVERECVMIPACMFLLLA